MKRPLLVIFGEKKAFRTLETIINCQMIFKSFCKTHFPPIKDTFIQCPLLWVHITIEYHKGTFIKKIFYSSLLSTFAQNFGLNINKVARVEGWWYCEVVFANKSFKTWYVRFLQYFTTMLRYLSYSVKRPPNIVTLNSYPNHLILFGLLNIWWYDS